MMQNRRVNRNCILGDEMVRTPSLPLVGHPEQCAGTNMAEPMLSCFLPAVNGNL